MCLRVGNHWYGSLCRPAHLFSYLFLSARWFADTLLPRVREAWALAKGPRRDLVQGWRELVLQVGKVTAAAGRRSISPAFSHVRPFGNSEQSGGLRRAGQVHRDLFNALLADALLSLDGAAALLEASLPDFSAPQQGSFHGLLQEAHGVGPFMADQILVDVCVLLLCDVRFLSVGPGTRRGLCLLRKEKFHFMHAKDDDEWLVELIRVHRSIGLSRSVHHTAHELCEFQKKVRCEMTVAQRRAYGAVAYTRPR